VTANDVTAPIDTPGSSHRTRGVFVSLMRWDPREIVPLNRKAAFKRESESFGGMSVGTLSRSGICPRFPCLDLQPERRRRGWAERAALTQRLLRTRDLRHRMRKRREGNLSAFRVYQWGTEFRSSKQGSPCQALPVPFGEKSCGLKTSTTTRFTPIVCGRTFSDDLPSPSARRKSGGLGSGFGRTMRRFGTSLPSPVSTRRT
jgi:hypothetical protein